MLSFRPSGLCHSNKRFTNPTPARRVPAATRDVILNFDWRSFAPKIPSVQPLAHILPAVGGYLLGSIPTGYLVAKAKGIDIRTVGSGNIGATNVVRMLGYKAGLLVLLSDAAKGFLACWLIARLVTELSGTGSGDPASHMERLKIIGGVAAILGHNYTCWLRFKGGKGVATTAGVLLGLFPMAFLIGLGVWLAVLGLSRYVSLASIAAAAALPGAVWVVGASPTLIWVAGLLGALAIYKHKSNLQRLIGGTEPRFGQRKPVEDTK
jgi:acyl phosphate:glycerol-3-phosphate acyltransferase